jgi:hypothetical protein
MDLHLRKGNASQIGEVVPPVSQDSTNLQSPPALPIPASFHYNYRICISLLPPLIVVLIWGGYTAFTTLLMGVCIAAVFDIFGKKEG